MPDVSKQKQLLTKIHHALQNDTCTIDGAFALTGALCATLNENFLRMPREQKQKLAYSVMVTLVEVIDSHIPPHEPKDHSFN